MSLHTAHEPDHHAQATELYARGYAGTREIAERMVADDPAGVAAILARHPHGELTDPRDVASPPEWNGCG